MPARSSQAVIAKSRTRWTLPVLEAPLLRPHDGVFETWRHSRWAKNVPAATLAVESHCRRPHLTKDKVCGAGQTPVERWWTWSESVTQHGQISIRANRRQPLGPIFTSRLRSRM